MSFDNTIILTPAQLARCGLENPSQALKNLDLLSKKLGHEALRELVPFLLTPLTASADPDMALNNLERFVSSLSDGAAFISLCRERQDVLQSLIAVFGASRFLSSFIVARAVASLQLLSAPGYLANPAGRSVLSERLNAAIRDVEGDGEFYRVLRIFRKQEMLRIGLRDLLGKADLRETVSELSDLAGVCLQKAYERIDAELTKKHGRPVLVREDVTTSAAGFAVIAMGKFGGNELNFSSDIDLMYAYSADGETEGVPSQDGALSNRITNHQYFVKLAERLTAVIGESTEDGFVFRVDLRLRPEGQRGPLAQSLGGYEIYYESWGQTWERSALIKARPVAGDENVGQEFLERITPFVFRKYLDYGAIAEIREMKQKINKDVQQKGKTYRDVKLGYGGIREIEFVIQALQLMYAGRDKSLRERNALKALHALSQKGLITYQEQADLSKAYVFLRTVEHRLQILNDLQTQTLPSDHRELRALARRAGYLEQGNETEALLRDYALHTHKVRAVYDNLFEYAADEAAPEDRLKHYDLFLDPETTEQESVAALKAYGFRDPGRAYRNLFLLREGPAFVHQTPRNRRRFGEIFPLIFHEIIASVDPDRALNHLESFLAAQGSWDAFQSLVKQDGMAVKVLIAIFANSEYFSRMFVASPELLEDMLDTSRSFSVGATAVLDKELAAALDKAHDVPEKLDVLRKFKQREEIRIGMADLLSAIPPQVASRALSRLAEVCLKAALSLAMEETGRRYKVGPVSSGLAIIGAGKLGSREMTYGSDLDILFLFFEERAVSPPAGLTAFEFYNKIAEKTISYLTTMTREGFLYRVDSRLRPGGSKGPLAQSLAAFRNYYSTQARTWEKQALTNSRCVAGDRIAGGEFSRSLLDMIYQETNVGVLAADIRSMRKRMEDELGKEDATHYNIKQGAGGIVDIEFIVQFLQLSHGKQERWARLPGTYNALRALGKRRLLSPEDFQVLRKAFLFMRQLESRMRIVSNQSTNELRRDPEQLRSLARRMGYADDAATAGQKLLSDYERLSKEVRSVFDRVLRSELR
jgi:glutamate-ammonia-ligase adenylyltransferase